MKKRLLAVLTCMALVISLASVSMAAGAEENTAETGAITNMRFDNSAWYYDEAVNVYYQIGIVYCEAPASTDYESLAIYVPGEYMIGTENGDGTYTCTFDPAGEVNGFTVDTAPIVIPVKTPGYMALAAQKEYKYKDAKDYVNAGFIYVHAGCRGRDNVYDDNYELSVTGGAPWGVTDLKAAIRYLRYNKGAVPGDVNTVFTFGMSGGGAQSALMGATGNSEEYNIYLEEIGALMTAEDGSALSDAVTGAMCWCPITSLDVADMAYEWNMGQFDHDGMRAPESWGSALSADLANAFADYLNGMEFQDEEGNVLTLEEGGNGLWMAGSYYDYLVDVANTSLNNYIADNNLNAAEYAAQLNEEAGAKWILVNEDGTALVTDLADVTAYWKKASKEVAAFDDLSGKQPENRLFGNSEQDAAHFDPVIAQLLADNKDIYAGYENWDPSYVDAYAEYAEIIDMVGNDIPTRQNLYNPIYYISDKSAGCNTSDIAKYWRINTGLKQSDTALTTEVNLVLALSTLDDIDVQFTTVWDQPHVEAERTGDYTENFLDWVFECLGNDTERVVRESGIGDTSEEEGSSGDSGEGESAGDGSAYTLAEGYDLYEEFDFYFEAVDQTVPILASITEDQSRMNLQFDFFGDKQDVTLEFNNDTWVVTEDASGFMSIDGPVIAQQAMDENGWHSASEEALASPYEPAVGYEMYQVFPFYFAGPDQTVVVMASTNTVQTRMNLQFDFFGEKQDVTLEYVNDAWFVKEDASGFMSIDGPVIAQAAVDAGEWIIK